MTEKEQAIKEIVTQYWNERNQGNHAIGAYTMMHRRGFKDSSDMQVFERFFDELANAKSEKC